MKTTAIAFLSLLMVAPAMGQSVIEYRSLRSDMNPPIIEKLTPKIPETHNAICSKHQCRGIIFSAINKRTIYTSIHLHGQDFFAWSPLCVSCSVKEQDNLAVKALEDRVKRQFPDARSIKASLMLD